MSLHPQILDRPETVESLFVAYRLTGDPKYRQWGWEIFSAIEEHCKVEGGGYAAVLNVDAVPVQQEDKMETFLMASGVHSFASCRMFDHWPTSTQSETLKYLFLLFSDGSVLPLDG